MRNAGSERKKTGAQRALTVAEMRSMFARLVVASSAKYWSNVDSAHLGKPAGEERTAQDLLEGAGHSVLSAMDGSGLNISGMAVASKAWPEMEGLAGIEQGLAELAAKEMQWSEGLDLARARLDIGDWKPEGGELGELMARLAAAAMRWAGDVAGEEGHALALKGFMLSLCCALEGPPGKGFAVMCMPSEEDPEYRRSCSENWEPLLPEGHPAAERDMGGNLRYEWAAWGFEKGNAKLLRSALAAADEARHISEAACLAGHGAPKGARL